jgi:GMP synthase-like glutamine amidotransferase
VFDHHHRGIRHVHADLHDRGRHEHVHLAARKRRHHAVFLVGLQTAVQQGHLEFRKDVGLQVVRHRGGGAQFTREDSSTSG